MRCIQVESKGLLDEFGKTQQHEAVALHVFEEFGPFLDFLVTIAKEETLLLPDVCLQEQLYKLLDVVVVEVYR